jgi:hypothetical protein
VRAAQLPRLKPVDQEPEPENRTIFVGYPYALPKDDYRGVFAKVAEGHDVQ